MDPIRRPATGREASARGAAGEPAAGRPTLGQLVFWLTGCAIYFSLARRFLPEPPERARQILLLSALALYTSLSWTGMAVVLRRLTGRRPTAIEPGAWLLFSLGCILTIDLAVALLPAGFPVKRESLQIGGTCLALALPTLSRRMPGRWKALLALLTLLAAAQLVVLLGALSMEVELSRESLARFRIIRASVGLVMLAAVTLLDHRARRHGWLDIVGVVAMAVWLVMLFR